MGRPPAPRSPADCLGDRRRLLLPRGGAARGGRRGVHVRWCASHQRIPAALAVSPDPAGGGVPGRLSAPARPDPPAVGGPGVGRGSPLEDREGGARRDGGGNDGPPDDRAPARGPPVAGGGERPPPSARLRVVGG